MTVMTSSTVTMKNGCYWMTVMMNLIDCCWTVKNWTSARSYYSHWSWNSPPRMILMRTNLIVTTMTGLSWTIATTNLTGSNSTAKNLTTAKSSTVKTNSTARSWSGTI